MVTMQIITLIDDIEAMLALYSTMRNEDRTI